MILELLTINQIFNEFEHTKQNGTLMFGTNSICYQRPKAGYKT